MYNLNVNLATSAANAVNNLLAVESGCTTPRTPEILNSLIAMTNPLDNYTFGDDAPKTAIGPPTSMSSDSNSSSCSQLESPTNAPPSIQHTCSQLIKAGLKLSIEQKRKLQSDGEDLLDLDKCKRVKKSECSESEEDKHNNGTGLTPEDEERRRRRRERNKIAATKCRLKKREKTANLVSESEVLETQNIELKAQIQELQNQRRQLLEMLTVHRPVCQRNIPPATREAIFDNRLPPVSLVIETNHSYNRPASVNSNYTNQNEVYNRPASVGLNNDISYNRSMQYIKSESLIVSGSNSNYQPPQLINLDDQLEDSYYTQCHNYNTQNYGTTTGLDSGCMA